MINNHVGFLENVLGYEKLDELWKIFRQLGYKGGRYNMIADMIYSMVQNDVCMWESGFTEKEYLGFLVEEMNLNYGKEVINK